MFESFYLNSYGCYKLNLLYVFIRILNDIVTGDKMKKSFLIVIVLCFLFTISCSNDLNSRRYEDSNKFNDVSIPVEEIEKATSTGSTDAELIFTILSPFSMLFANPDCAERYETINQLAEKGNLDAKVVLFLEKKHMRQLIEYQYAHLDLFNAKSMQALRISSYANKCIDSKYDNLEILQEFYKKGNFRLDFVIVREKFIQSDAKELEQLAVHYPFAKLFLARLYLQGSNILKENPEKGITLLKEVAKEWNPGYIELTESTFFLYDDMEIFSGGIEAYPYRLLALIYMNGYCGIEQNYEEALKWYKLARNASYKIIHTNEYEKEITTLKNLIKEKSGKNL